MLWKTSLVKPNLETYLKLVFAKEPHSLALLHHAEIVGNESKELYDYLMKKRLVEKTFSLK
ncbi:hypothetical protein [Aquimarina algiphila]|uniref:hypothetical protein n=1 Tax=Aquimarina algiphila TaxID=2047982 RepID=UPI002492D02D|nr:hypothetical protein [Aquimarina algiphila]